MASTKLWGGRFTEKASALFHKFNESLSYDRRMWKADIRGSIAYASALVKAGIIGEAEWRALEDGLARVGKEWESGEFRAEEDDEDIHSANERRLGELIGREIAGKLHTGRSRNDQVATDLRLWLRDEVDALADILRQAIKALVERAKGEIELVMPGYTHLQRAQPIRWSHLLMSYAWTLHADLQRLQEYRRRMNQLPLGSGALAGNPFALDREMLAQELGFDSVVPNSLVGVSDRDFVVEFTFWAALTQIHLSKLAEDFIIYSSAEFGFITLADAYSSGSSLMPQKKNPDSLELLRGKSGRIFGGMAGFMMSLKGLPSTYNKDLQEDKEPLFDAVETIASSLQIAAAVVETLSVHPERMKKSLTVDMLATDLADYLVRRGVPFRDTHHISGQAVRLAESRGCHLDNLTLQDYQGLHPKFERDVLEVFDFEQSVERRESIGGTSRSRVLDQIRQLERALEV